MKFFATLLLATAAIAAPTSPNSNIIRETSSCMSKSMKASSWVAKDFTFKYVVTESDGAKSYDSKAAFTLKNDALSYTAKCTGKSHSKNFFDGKLTYECNSGDDTSDKATFSYDYKSGKLVVGQVWSCPKEGARFTANGDTAISLTCKETDSSNKKTVECTPKTITVPIKSISAVA
ncbi:hypothetical protein B0T10DRAFT_459924 [Thelonectria olida]|uniref:AA1-like domain-containing protein n=1 Tax=Thelonectria olida TaxID=1576542 RepID=A0A9P8W4Q0_9HYPO|nr:hypothetical protein B0T10DRAFT_459924 [Thelonectria olida]